MEKIIIAGAGPVGLAAAVFLRLQGREIEIFDPLIDPSPNSKALAVNPRTLDLLESTGVTAQILNLGLPIHFAQLWRDQKKIREVRLGDLPNHRPFMVALSQAVTEKLLKEKLESLGVTVQRGWGLKSIEQTNGEVRVQIQSSVESDPRTLSGTHVIAADGSHSRARQLLGIPFDGSTMKGEWHLADVHFKTDLAEDRAHIEVVKGGGFRFYLRVVEDCHKEKDPTPVWRIFSSSPFFLDSLSMGKVEGTPVWQSHFKISHRINREFSHEHVYFMGDSAHVHSPLGARGMNLGIEDAWTFSHLLAEGKENLYAEQRRAIDATVVRKIAFASRVFAGQSLFTRALRKIMLNGLGMKPLQLSVTEMMSGLDHVVT